MSSYSSLSLTDIQKIPFEEFMSERIEITSIRFKNGRKNTCCSDLVNWLNKNKLNLYFYQFKSSSVFGGSKYEYTYKTAYFKLTYSYEDGYDENLEISPISLKEKQELCAKKNPDPEILNKTPSILDLWFGFNKKYPESIDTCGIKKSKLNENDFIEVMHKTKN
ncbi:hypothetical protein HLH17_02120 [Acinetobacter sp. ANC 5380]|uniref:Uncharacterized protein n=1 Tax=Acinetobacter terrae TaxID=2731247 RepID=A0A7Y2RCY0_9GAMM|nr:hypothetical protein [Acinetobacter terrae]NNH76498.1 hypothetical protein [Acinetobacter terrae]